MYEYLIQEGTIVVKKDASMPRHQNLPIPNLKVMMVCKSLASKKLLNSTFNWQWYYYSLTPEGIRGMCEYLGLPPNIKPEIYKPQASQRL